MDLRKGGKAAIERMLEAYGFTTKQALCQQLGISSSTLANRYLRDTFPADYIIQCALETGASLQWLVTGESNLDGHVREKNIILKKLINNQLENIGSYKVDTRITPDFPTNIFALKLNNDDIYLISSSLKRPQNGLWLVNIDSEYFIKKITKLPDGKIKIEEGEHSFISKANELTIEGGVICIHTKTDLYNYIEE
ncbi:phage repressor protein CI [Enterobacter asburiae]|uniref:phage repressor protein CI n=1 Tax=Enterobacter asburiae TaxID=61645 RepID=UPI002074CF8C|nr:phage repressor protein CI [Enterobacter asburiae]MCM7566787.1 helix-turn-helix domain-containing protein [Enterobacter asburiae]